MTHPHRTPTEPTNRASPASLTRITGPPNTDPSRRPSHGITLTRLRATCYVLLNTCYVLLNTCYLLTCYLLLASPEPQRLPEPQAKRRRNTGETQAEYARTIPSPIKGGDGRVCSKSLHTCASLSGRVGGMGGGVLSLPWAGGDGRRENRHHTLLSMGAEVALRWAVVFQSLRSGPRLRSCFAAGSFRVFIPSRWFLVSLGLLGFS